MPKVHLNPSDLPDWRGSFSQLVIHETGTSRHIAISGQVSVDAEHRIVAPGDLAGQARRAFENLATALAAAGATPSNVMRLGISIVDYRPEQAEIIREAMRALFVSEPLPASTWLGVESLALQGLLVEIEATAIVEMRQDDQG